MQQNAPTSTTVLNSVRHLQRRSPWRAFAPMVCIGCIGLAAVLVAGSWRPYLAAAMGSVLAASLSVFAAYTSYQLKQEDDARLEERRRIAEQMGLAEALIAEIEDNKRGSEAVHDYASITSIWERMTADPAFIPFMVEDEGGSQVYAAAIERLLMLPYPVVRAVVRYYAADTNLNESIAALRSADFRALCDPKQPGSVAAGRPRQMRFIMWTLLSICDIYDVPVGGGGTQPGSGDPEFEALIAEHLRERAVWAAAMPDQAIPYADRAIAELRAFVADCQAARSFLEQSIIRR